ncbi:hypothetical protein [Akkermansia sp. KLE1797]|uniref:hypothetical protein n=2 Tax=unclassified Akkermansia TaxID=2608915 RepID=UPI0018D46475|nr:hypothetical protein [Akkermansia sp. KLE1797]
MGRMIKYVPVFCLFLIGGLVSRAVENPVAVPPASSDAPEAPLPSGELLSDHVAEAEFTGIIHRKCMFMTSLCPDKCDHPKDFATFWIIKYLDYRKPGKYGDEKQEKLMVDVNPAHKPILQDASVLKQIAALKPGDKVVLHWSHYYMHQDSSSFPQRPVISIKPLSPSGGAEKE